MNTSTRSIISISGEGRYTFLQGILTNDLLKLNDDKIQFAALLSPQGKILHDMFVVAWDNAILLDSDAAFAEILKKRLTMYKLRAKVAIEDVTHEIAVTHDDSGLADPRHPGLPHRLYRAASSHDSRLTTHDSLTLGIPELGRDFAPDSIVAMDAGYDLLHAISFTKGCYIGQEVTARMHYKNIARKGFFILSNETMPTRLALLKFEDVFSTARFTTHDSRLTITVDNIAYRAELPGWMLPKFEQFIATREMQ